MNRVKKIFLLGIGGVGMSAIAKVLLHLGYQVSGSDIKSSIAIDRLRLMGADIAIGHRANNIVGSDVVVISSAITSDNLELQTAYKLGIPVIKRAEMLAELMRFRFGIAVAGTHGKTTTTCLIASLLHDAGLDPSFVVGGVLNAFGSNARLGLGKYLVAEADESDGSFWYLQPMISVVTNIDNDHLENYNNDFDQLKQGFIRFLHNLPFYGLAVVCFDDLVIKELLPEIARPVISYGFDDGADIQAVNVVANGFTTNFEVKIKNLPETYPIKLNMSGRHNVLNALATLAIGRDLGISIAKIANSLGKFQGVERRFTHHGTIQHKNGKADIFEDYGHHPSEIKAVLTASRESFANRRVVVVFQPHRFSRTSALFEQFVEVLAIADMLVLTDTYSAGEEYLANADSKALFNKINCLNDNCFYIADKNQINQQLINHLLQDGDVVIYFGAGDIGSFAKKLI